MQMNDGSDLRGSSLVSDCGVLENRKKELWLVDDRDGACSRSRSPRRGFLGSSGSGSDFTDGRGDTKFGGRK